MNSDTYYTSYPTSVSNPLKYMVLFLLWPFLAFVTAIFNYSQKDSKRVVSIFLIYYGLTFVLGDAGVDAERYASALQDTAELPFSDFFAIVGGLYTDTTVDIMQPLVTFIVSRFTTSYHILFAVWAAIFGFFYLKSINQLHNQYVENPGWNAFIFMAFFVFVMPITTLGGIRMPIATWVFFLGAYHVIINRNPRYLILALSASLVHWSFISANVVLFIYFFAGNRNMIYLPILVASFILPGLMSPVFESLAYSLGGPIQDRYEGYANEMYIEGMQDSYQGAPWFVTMGSTLCFYFFILAIVIIQFTDNQLVKDKPQRNLFSFLLLFLSFVNFGKVIPTFGGRFQDTFFLFASLYVFLYFLKKPGNRLNFITLIGLFPMLLFTVVMLRVGSVSVNTWLFAPGIGLPLLIPGVPISELLF